MTTEPDDEEGLYEFGDEDITSDDDYISYYDYEGPSDDLDHE